LGKCKRRGVTFGQKILRGLGICPSVKHKNKKIKKVFTRIFRKWKEKLEERFKEITKRVEEANLNLPDDEVERV